MVRDATGRLCVGAAWAKTPLGPYTDIGHPLIRNATMGSIDPHLYDDRYGSNILALTKCSARSGNLYLFWKEDGNAPPPETYVTLWAIQTAPDGLSLVGNRTFILQYVVH